MDVDYTFSSYHFSATKFKTIAFCIEYVWCRLEMYKHENVIVNFVRYILDKTIFAIVRFIYILKEWNNLSCNRTNLKLVKRNVSS